MVNTRINECSHHADGWMFGSVGCFEYRGHASNGSVWDLTLRMGGRLMYHSARGVNTAPGVTGPAVKAIGEYYAGTEGRS